MSTTMPAHEFDRLCKLMSLTTSENDHEALASIRAANRILHRSGLLWDSILKPSLDSKVSSHPDSEDEVEDCDYGFDYIMLALEFSLSWIKAEATKSFLSGLVDYYLENEFLTAKQFNALVMILKRADAAAKKSDGYCFAYWDQINKLMQ